MGELCLVVKFGQKRTGNNKKGVGKMKKDNLKSMKNEKNYKKKRRIHRAENIEIL
jgi:hypothetical protein